MSTHLHPTFRPSLEEWLRRAHGAIAGRTHNFLSKQREAVRLQSPRREEHGTAPPVGILYRHPLLGGGFSKTHSRWVRAKHSEGGRGNLSNIAHVGSD
jgi:hypothetical protein